uniref:Cytochrome c-type biogenesis protein CcmE n=2 Tax=unclassified Candidatus Kentrum TaxID=2643149 RepID=A0A451ABG2_9GAMM|nr:MAG: cytochrome c-type biogenesis protein CcmE [Candidatus Kentron sp. LPFa]VFK63323.1 MAG: cytochrome c-type biogenesis protein CcmE [Candidatus Kentron sp. UNK]VFK70801.1 MAG: cytochrome c-type biogenesis protein CcmE [Candidatus Kentron sp. UNK]
MKHRFKQRLFIVAGVLLGVGAAAWLVFSAISDNMRYFVSPSEIQAGAAPKDQALRVGGLVVAGSVRRGEELTVHFELTDNASTIPVTYTGILPDLFREGQGIVATGRLRADGVFAAREVLAKHDENYMPREVQEALDKAEDAKAVGDAMRESAGGSL